MNYRHIFVVISILSGMSSCLGMLDSIGIFSKDELEQQVCILTQDTNSHDSQETLQFASYFERWAALNNAPTCIIMHNPCIIRAQGQHVTVKDLIGEKYQYDCAKFIMGKMASNPDAYKNIRFATPASQDARQFHLTFFANQMPDLLKKTAIECDIQGDIYRLPLKSLIQEHNIFKKNGFFDLFKQKMLELYNESAKTLKDNPMTVEEFFNHFEQQIEKFKIFMRRMKSSDPRLKKIIEGYIKDSQTAYEKLRKFFEENCRDFKRSLTSAQLEIVRKTTETSYGDIYHAIRDATVPAAQVLNRLQALTLILDQLKKNPRILFLCSHQVGLELYSALEAYGFEKKIYGSIESSFGRFIQEHKKQFTPQVFDAILATLFFEKTTAAQSLLQIDGPVKESPVELQKEIPTQQVTAHTCVACGRTKEIHYHYAIMDAKNAYCSFPCFLTDFQRKNALTNPAMCLFTKSKALSANDIIILKRCASLLYHCMIPLKDGIADDRSLLFNCNQEALCHRLKKIAKKGPHTKDARLWTTSLAMARIFGVDIDFLIKILMQTRELKNHYLIELVKQTKALDYKKMLLEDQPVFFDPQNLLHSTLSAYCKQIAASLGLDLEIARRTQIYRVYKDLLKQIVHTLGGEINFEEVLNECIDDASPSTLVPAAAEKTSRLQGIEVKTDLPGAASAIAINTINTEQTAIKPISEQETISFEESKNMGEDLFYTSSKQKISRPIKSVQDFFAGRVPYTIEIFNTQKYFEGDGKPQERWKRVGEFKEAYRIKVLFALLADAQEKDKKISYNDDHGCIIQCGTSDVDSTLMEKLDLHHLFTHQVDQFLKSCGIVEQYDNLIQVSIPGSLTINGISKIGFFQYSFRPADCICIHRCFKEYSQNPRDGYISKPLRKALCDFLKEHKSDHPAIPQLKKLIV